jgi:PKHD-type hydroxylase
MYTFENTLPVDLSISDKHYQEWFFLWNKCGDEDLINKIIVTGESLDTNEASIGDSASSGINSKIRISQLSWIHKTTENQYVYDFMVDKIERINYWHYGMNITGVEPFQYTRYRLDGHYTFHHDITIRPDKLMRKLSVVMALSDKSDYEVGEFKLMPHGENPKVFKFNKGDLIAFPSWVPHKVEPVTSGKRITLVAWACGPKFI